MLFRSCGGAAWAAYQGLSRWGMGNSVAVGLSVGLGGVVYLGGLLLSQALVKKDLLMLPKGEKIAKALEKQGWI